MLKNKNVFKRKKIVACLVAVSMAASVFISPFCVKADPLGYSLSDIRTEAIDLDSQINKYLIETEATKSLMDIYCAALIDLEKNIDGKSTDTENLTLEIKKIKGKIGEAENCLKETGVGSDEESFYKNVIDAYNTSLQEIDILKETIPLSAANPQMYEATKNTLSAGCTLSKVLEKEYNDYFRAYSYLNNSYDNWVSNYNITGAFQFTGIDKSGSNNLFFRGVAYPYDDDYVFLEKDGVKTNIKIYDAMSPEGNIKFYYDTNASIVVLMGTPSVPEGTYFEDDKEDETAEEPVYEPRYRDRVKSMLSQINSKLTKIQPVVAEISKQTEDVSKILGKTTVSVDEDAFKDIKTQLAAIMVKHDALKSSYNSIKAKVYNENITKEQLKKTDLSKYIGQLEDEKDNLLNLKSEIEKFSEKATLTNDNKVALLKLLNSIDEITESVDKDITMFSILKTVGSSSGDVVSTVTDLINDKEKLEEENKRLIGNDVKVKQLEDKIKELSTKSSTVGSKVSSLANTNNDAAKKISSLTDNNTNLSKATQASKSAVSSLAAANAQEEENKAKSKNAALELAEKAKEDGTINHTSDKAKVSNPITSGVFDNFNLSSVEEFPQAALVNNADTYDSAKDPEDIAYFDFGAETEGSLSLIEGNGGTSIYGESGNEIEAQVGTVSGGNDALPIVLIISGICLLVIGGAVLYIFNYKNSTEDDLEYDENDLLYSEDEDTFLEDEIKDDYSDDEIPEPEDAFELLTAGDFSDEIIAEA